MAKSQEWHNTILPFSACDPITLLTYLVIVDGECVDVYVCIYIMLTSMSLLEKSSLLLISEQYLYIREILLDYIPKKPEKASLAIQVGGLCCH